MSAAFIRLTFLTFYRINYHFKIQLLAVLLHYKRNSYTLINGKMA